MSSAPDTLRVLCAIDSLRAEGSQTSLLEIARRLPHHGVSLTVASLGGRGDLADEFETAGTRVIPYEGNGDRRSVFRFVSATIREKHPELVHTTLYEADVLGRVASRLCGVPVVTSLVNASYGREHYGDPGLRRWKLTAAHALDAITARLAVRMHAVSRDVADVMSRRLRYPRPRIDVVPRGRDPQRLGTRTPERRARVRHALGLADGERIVLAVGRQEHQKGFDLLLEAVAQCRPELGASRVLVAGRPGTQTAALEALRARLGLDETVQFLGARDDVADLLAAADAFVFPSRREGFPGAVVEAMALEAPIVATNIAQTREAVGNQTAVLVPTESPKALADGLVATLADPDAAAVRATRARERFTDQFTSDAVAAEMVRFYRESLETARRNRDA